MNAYNAMLGHAAIIGTVIPICDVYWTSVTSLMHFNGVDGSTSIIDECGLTWTNSTTNVVLDTAIKKYGSASAMAMDVASQRLNQPANAAFGFGTGDYTIEFFVNPDNLSVLSFATILQLNNGVLNQALYFDNRNSFVCRFSGGVDITAAGITSGTWYHVAMTRAAGVGYFFVNGVLIGTTANASDFGATFPCYLFATITSANAFKGWIDEFRVTNGVARYTANFTVPTMEFGSVAC